MSPQPKMMLLAAALLAGTAFTAVAKPMTSKVFGPPEKAGTINLTELALGAGGGPAPGAALGESSVVRTKTLRDWRVMPLHPRPDFGAKATRGSVSSAFLDGSSAAAPLAESLGITSLVAGSLTGFNGVDHYDQRMLADNGNQFSLEPPDQALAVGNGYVVEAVNNALNVYDTAGNSLLAAPVSMNRFFNQVSEINRSYENQRGPFLSDPRAFYDYDLKRFFVVEWATLNDAAGNSLNISVQFIAVSATSDPTGGWYIYSFQTTNETVPGCPCFPDYQQIGLDKHGLYITSNLFGIAAPSPFVGAKIYAVSKQGLANGTGATIVEFAPLPNDFTVHPTAVPPGGRFSSADKGTEYLVESPADTSTSGRATSLTVFAISNTSSLSQPAPSLTLASVSATTMDYGNAAGIGLPPAIQPDGPRPLGGTGPGGLNAPVPLLDAGDARIGSTPLYVNGKIWTVIGTAVTGAQYSYSGFAWFDVKVTGGTSSLAASVLKEGTVVAGPGTSLLYPAIAMPASGNGAIGVTVTGPANYPSTAIVPITSSGKTGSIMLSAIATLPDDGFTAYAAYGGTGGGRWGDYGAAAVDEFGALWMANEYIPDTTLHPRTSLANWGTYVTTYTP